MEGARGAGKLNSSALLRMAVLIAARPREECASGSMQR